MQKKHNYRNIIDHLDDCITVLDSNWQIVFANTSFCKLLGKTEDELIGFLVQDILTSAFSKNQTKGLSEKEFQQEILDNDICIGSRWFHWSSKFVLSSPENNTQSQSILLAGREITERKKEELLLKENDYRHRQFIENQPVGMFRTRFEGAGEFVIANSAAAELLGYSSKEALLETTSLEFYKNPSDRKVLLDRLLVEEKIIGVQVESKKKDGSAILLSLSLQLIKDCEGRPIETNGTVIDISDMKRIEEALWMTQFIYERAAVGIYRINLKGEILDANNMAANMLGYSIEEMTSMNIWDVDPEVTAENWSTIWERASEAGASVFERNHRRKDGICIPVEVFSNHIEYKGQEYSVAFASDVSKRKSTQKELQTSEEMHIQAQKIAQLGHWEKMFGTDDVIWSDEVYRIHELDKSNIKENESLYNLALERVHPEDHSLVNSAIAEALASKTDLDIIHRIVLPGDRVKHLHVIASIEFSEDGLPFKTVGTVQDVTARRVAEIAKERVEKKLLQSQKLEAVGTLAGGIAHDFNNILTAIIGFTQLGMNRLPKESKVLKNLEEVIKAGLRARELVAHILTFSRKEDHFKEVVDLGLIINEVVKLLRATIPVNIEITHDIASSCCTVYGVPVQFHQIILNICTNAHHAIGNTNGRISITLQGVEIGRDDFRNAEGYEAGSYLELTIADTGMGMEQSTLEQLFDPYFSTKQKGEGTGLGLSVVHGIVKKHEGFIRVYSERGKGSTFLVYLPCVKEKKTKEHASAEITIPVGTETIMIVDDELPITEMMTGILGNLGYRIRAFNDPEHAAEYYLSNKENIDLVITDLTMPLMDGLALAAIIRKMDRKVPIILQSGFSDLIPKKSIREIGISAVIRKPVLEVELAQCIREELGRNNEQ